jgi:hypothetical protein
MFFDRCALKVYEKEMAVLDKHPEAPLQMNQAMEKNIADFVDRCLRHLTEK